MKKKRALAFVLAAALCASAFAGCKTTEPKPSEGETQASQPAVSESKLNFNQEGYPVSDTGMEFDIYALKWPAHRVHYSEMQVFVDHEKRTNLHINFTEMPLEGLQEKKNLVFANKDGLPDAFWGQIYRGDELLNFAAQGLVIPLNDLIDQYGPNIKKAMEEFPALKKAMTAPDGNIYSLAGAAQPGKDPQTLQSKMYINQVWLDKLGEKVPTTVEELYRVLKKMKGVDLNENGKDDEIPMAIEPGRIIHTMFSWGVDGIYTVKDGKVKSSYLEPGFREGIRWFNRLYEEGLLDIETFTQTWGQMSAKGSGPEMRYGFFSRTNCDSVVGLNHEPNYVAVPPLEGPAGRRIINDESTGLVTNKFTITCNCKDPGALIRWVDYFYTPEGALQAIAGNEGEAWEKNDDGTFQRLDFKPKVKGVTMPGGTTPGFCSGKYVIPGPRNTRRLEEVKNVYMPFVIDEYFPARMNYSLEEAEIRTEYVPTIESLTEEAMANFIIGNLDIDSDKDYNNFINELKNVGIEELLKVEQSAYDRYIATK